MKLLLTAFDPFGGETLNASREAMALVPDWVQGCEIIKITLPTVFGQCVELLRQALETHRPRVALCLGQAGGRAEITPERIAINLDDARIPDNQGNQPLDLPVRAGGPAAYFSNLPVKAMVQAIRDAGLPASLSNTAGTFVCNHLMYGLLDEISNNYPEIRGGFIHVPCLPEQGTGKNQPGLPREDIARGVTAAIRAILEHSQDVQRPEGKTR